MAIRALSVLLFGGWTALAAQETKQTEAARIIAQLNRTVTYRDVAISPDGRRLAWVQSTAGASGGTVHVFERETERDIAVSLPHESASRADRAPAWSPDSNTLVFFSENGKEGSPEVWATAGDGKKARRVAELNGFADRLRWSPEGTRVGFLYVEGGHGGGPLMATGALTGVIDTGFRNQRVAAVDPRTGHVSAISPADLHVYDFDWSPDGKHLVATAAPGPGDNNWWIAKLYLFNLADGGAKVLYTPKLQIAVPRWSPDGKQVAFIEGLMSDEGFHGGDLYTIEASGGTARNRMEGRKTSASSIAWKTPTELTFSEYSNGGVNLATLNLLTGVIEGRWHGEEEARAGGNFPNLAVAHDGVTCAIVRSSFSVAPEVWAGKLGEWKPVTHGNAGMRPLWGKAESLEWTNGGWQIQGWLLHPAHERAGKSPLIVNVHGGPSGIVVPSWPSRLGTAAFLAASGYYVLLPNPRGSYGGGEAFTQANVKDFGYEDLQDIEAGVDAAVAKFPIDNSRVGLTGWSYGGFMTMFGVTQTTRFAAAVAGAGIADWTSYYGENLIDQWMIPFFGASVYDDPAIYAKSSPLQFIKRVKTPTLVVVGEQDAECPAPQSFEFWHALRTLGVPTQLVVYPGEGHMFVKPADVEDLVTRTVAWFDRYLNHS